MNLFDDTTVRNPESTIETMTSSNDSHTGGSAVVDAPEQAQPSSAEPLASAHDVPGSEVPKDPTSETHENAAAASDDFAAALQNFETETEESVGDDHVIKGTVVKLTATHVVVDIGAKSEGMLPIAEILDHEGNPKFQPGAEIDVLREKG